MDFAVDGFRAPLLLSPGLGLMGEQALPREKKFGRVAIVGVGLVGGSLGLALKKRGLADEVVGVCRRRVSLQKAQKRRAVDWGTLSLKKGVQGANLVVLAVPPGLIVEKGLEAAAVMEKGAVLTDAGSVKGVVVEELDRRLPPRVAFVGGHPIAGSEKRGVEAASADLFAGSVCVVTPSMKSTSEGVRTVTRMWKGVGCSVVKLSPGEHDLLLGEVSHLPHVVAAALTRTVSERGLRYAGAGFGDTTRIASGDSGLWADILIGNRREIGKAAARLLEELKRFQNALARGEREEVAKLLGEARKKRQLFEAKRNKTSKGRS